MYCSFHANVTLPCDYFLTIALVHIICVFRVGLQAHLGEPKRFFIAYLLELNE